MTYFIAEQRYIESEKRWRDKSKAMEATIEMIESEVARSEMILREISEEISRCRAYLESIMRECG